MTQPESSNGKKKKNSHATFRIIAAFKSQSSRCNAGSRTIKLASAVSEFIARSGVDSGAPLNGFPLESNILSV